MTLLELTTRVLCDVKANSIADAAYLFSQTRDNQQSVLSAAKRLFTQQLVKKILFVKSDPICGYPGFSSWENELLGMGVPKEAIIGVDPHNPNLLHSLIEAEGLIRHSNEHDFKEIYVIAAPFHQLRAFMTSVTVTLKHYPQLRIYSYPGDPLNWTVTVAHSQGTTISQRSKLIGGELDRIQTYQQKGDLDSVDAIFEYLDNRDGPAEAFQS